MVARIETDDVRHLLAFEINVAKHLARCHLESRVAARRHHPLLDDAPGNGVFVHGVV